MTLPVFPEQFNLWYSILFHKGFYSPLVPTCWNCLNTFCACPCTQEQLERSYQVFLYICIIVNIPHSIALKFKFLPTNSKCRGVLLSIEKSRQRENGFHLHSSEVTSMKTARQSTRYYFTIRAQVLSINLSSFAHIRGIDVFSIWLFQEREQTLISFT